MYPASPDSTALSQLHDQALREANPDEDASGAEAGRLRREAVDDFWRGANAVWQRGLAGALRQVQRRGNRFTPTAPQKA